MLRCHEPPVLLFFHHQDNKIMWVPNQTNGWMKALYRMYIHKTVIKEAKQRNDQKLRRDLNIDNNKDMWQAIQNTRLSKSMRPRRLKQFIISFLCSL